MDNIRNIGVKRRPRRLEAGRYRRRRLVAAALVAAGIFSTYQVAGAGAEPEPVLYTVQPGDTLWSLASEGASITEDPRLEVERIRSDNGLSGYEIRSGQVLRLSD
ncbi:LysM peptidoglycan-binding domain-containing protein [Rubrobacter indicoceani]|uniref:LysM peptidoglycan-binding domain-containing protein n=1 Tax=Rubrobacter indicoceani TaxID=2051957 RepID=UPI0013C411AE|nr:LysM peptidoglycan-binding domain-containing protein [Rubrobacter indicoceani]